TEVPLEHTKELRGVFDVLLGQPENGTVLLHCSGGKDRTGITTALILSALGVTRDDIEADFLMSNVQKQADKKAAEIAASVNEANGTSMTPEAVWPSLGIRADHLSTFYDSVSASYGSVDGYLRDGLGLTDEDLTRLRDLYLE
ncbi:MAG: tyrosine-protein phosphatase, partial [Pseudomonadota bacterium]